MLVSGVAFTGVTRSKMAIVRAASQSIATTDQSQDLCLYLQVSGVAMAMVSPPPHSLQQPRDSSHGEALPSLFLQHRAQRKLLTRSWSRSLGVYQFEALCTCVLRAVGVLFSPMLSGWAGGWREIVWAVSQKP